MNGSEINPALLSPIIKDVVQKYQAGVYKNEEHIRAQLVLRILQAVGWDIWNPLDVYTEYPPNKSEDNRRVDVALFDQSKARAYIEVKRPNALQDRTVLESTEQQIEGYNRYLTAPISVITDGFFWRFYLAVHEGRLAEKCFAEFNIANVDTAEYHFKVFLGRGALRTRDAENAARQVLQEQETQKRHSLLARLWLDIHQNAPILQNYPKALEDIFVKEAKSKHNVDVTADEASLVASAAKAPIATPIQNTQKTVSTTTPAPTTARGSVSQILPMQSITPAPATAPSTPQNAEIVHVPIPNIPEQDRRYQDIISMQYKDGQPQSFDNWRDMYRDILDLLHSQHPQTLPDALLKLKVASETALPKKDEAKQIGSVFVKCNLSLDNILRAVGRTCAELNINAADFKVAYKPTTKQRRTST